MRKFIASFLFNPIDIQHKPLKGMNEMQRFGSKTLRVGAAVALLASSGMLTACGSANQGGDTTCGDYLNMSSAEQDEVVRTFLEEDGQEHKNGEIMLVKGSALAFCNTIGKDSSKIREING